MKRFFIISALLCMSHVIGAAENLRGFYKSIRDVLIQENGEELVDLRNQSIIAYDASFLMDNPDCTQMRKTVYDKLCAAQQLLPNGLRFELNVGLRSLDVQEKLFNEMYEKIKLKFPKKNKQELFEETSKFVAPVKTWEGHQNTPPHSTGGAIDVILIDGQGGCLDLGEDPNDPFNPAMIQTNSTLISLEARKNRDIMATALSAVGFVNYPAEFWHWSYGDRRWAFLNHAKYSFYGPISFGGEKNTRADINLGHGEK
ncbi:MAG: M15 family metallopeptidase [Rhabdochlamydiaceae bacterium]|nr:M15 family metallopeptidase [Rhabdochlamydiaceae bacterium]